MAIWVVSTVDGSLGTFCDKTDHWHGDVSSAKCRIQIAEWGHLPMAKREIP
jgi:hypothetical protein